MKAALKMSHESTYSCLLRSPSP